MATIVTRSGKGSPLTHAEVDSNFTNLNTDKLELSGGTMTGNLSFGDNDKAIFGAGSDLQIYHDGNNSVIKDNGTGNLLIQGATDIVLEDTSGANYFRGVSGSYVRLYHNNSTKLETTSTGIDVTGTVTADGLTVDGAGSFTSSSTELLDLTSTGGDSLIRFGSLNSNFDVRIGSPSNPSTANGSFVVRTAGDDRLLVANNGDISFYEDTGTTAKFFWDASAESLGIGTSSPVTINGGSGLTGQNNSGFEFVAFRNDPAIADNDFVGAYLFGNNDASGPPNHYAGIWAEANDAFGAMDLQFAAGRTNYETNTPHMTILEGGNVGIGTGSPSFKADIRGGNASTVRFDNDGSQYTQVRWANNGTGKADINWDNSGSIFTLGTVVSSPMSFLTNGTERMRIDSSGNVGIGTSSPSSILHLSSAQSTVRTIAESTNAAGYVGYRATNGTGYWEMQVDGANQGLRWLDDGTERMRIDSSGNVGIGVVPSATGGGYKALQLGLMTNWAFPSTGSAYRSHNLYYDGTNRKYVTTGTAHEYEQSSAGHIFSTAASGTAGTNVTLSEAMRIDSSGNVGIGTTSPSGKLDVSYGDYQNSGAIKIGADLGQNTSRTDASRKFGAITAAHFDNDEADLGLITMDSSSASVSALTIGGGSSSFSSASSINFQTSSDGSSAGTTAMRITSSGNVEISSDDKQIYWGAGTTAIDASSANNRIRFFTSNSEAMRIDSSGNLLVGTTDATPSNNSAGTTADNGIALGADGLLEVAAYKSTANAGAVGYFNRTGTDGGIIDLRKDGTTVGSIGSQGGDSLTIGNGDTGLLISAANDVIHPWNTSTNAARDNAIDLGRSSHRFKDLYLSGGVYLGGTGAANKLDDYEEGTWTAQLSDGTNISSTTATGYYTKVGRIVHCMIAQFTNISTSGMSGILRLSLPFTPATGGFYSSGTAVMFSGSFPSNTYALRASIYHGETLGYLQAVGTNGAASLSTSNITSGTTDISQITFSYIT